MATAAENLQTMIDQIDQQLLTLTAQTLPGTILDGESIDVGAERDRLIAARKSLWEQLVAQEGPAEVRVQGWC